MRARQPSLRAGLARSAAVGLLLVASPSASNGADFHVTKTADTQDGVCDADCSLREAIDAANALAGADTVHVPAGLYTLDHPSGELQIATDLDVVGAGPAETRLDGNSAHRVLHVMGPATVSLRELTAQNGSVAPSGTGGGILNDGAQLTLENARVVDNDAGDPFAGDTGGGGGVYSSAGSLTLVGCEVEGNQAGTGGGINAGTVLDLDSSIVRSNAAVNGGGISVGAAGTATISATTISDNTAVNTGGGIWLIGLSGGSIHLENSTVSGNVGEGVAVLAGQATILSTTISDTMGANQIDGPATLENSIVAHPSSDNCFAVSSLGHNVADDGTCNLTEPGDQVVLDAGVEPLADQGGPTETHALAADSPAIDAGNDLTCPPADQRGFGRSGPCDVGSFEYLPEPGPLAPIAATAVIGFLRRSRRRRGPLFAALQAEDPRAGSGTIWQQGGQRPFDHPLPQRWARARR